MLEIEVEYEIWMSPLERSNTEVDQSLKFQLFLSSLKLIEADKNFTLLLIN
jgi:hypothetical protein